MVDAIIFNWFERFIWGIVISTLFIAAIQYFRSGKKMESANEKRILMGFGIFIVTHAIAWIIWLYGETLVEGYYIGHDFVGDLSEGNPLGRIGHIPSGIGYILLIYCFEKSIPRTKFIFTIIGIVIFTIFLITANFLKDFIMEFLFIPYITILFIGYLIYFTNRSRQEFKATSSIILVGMIIWMWGDSFHHPDVKILNHFPVWLAPIVTLLGIVIFISPTFIDPKYISKGKLYWLILGIFLLIFTWSLFFYMLMVIWVNLDDMLLSLAENILLTVIIIRTLFILKKGLALSEKEPSVDLLSMFTKPKKVTEEEVSISKEKKVCLVCKGKVGRDNIFLCPNCDTFYCKKCSEVLATLENACWAWCDV